jgi:NDP-sugar pyrophosphorylase family protein
MGSDCHDVRAMILAAGLGTRLRPLTETVPKAMVEVRGKPLIEYALETIQRAGIEEVVVNLHHLGDQIRVHLGNGSRFGLRIAYSTENPLQDSGGGIRDARPLLGDRTFVTLNSDTIVDIDLGELLAFHREHQAEATLALRKDPQQKSFGLIETDGEGRISRFLGKERPNCGSELESFMYTGVQVLEPVVFDYMGSPGPFSITKTTYPGMLADDRRLFGFNFKGPWVTVGTPAELAAANG